MIESKVSSEEWRLEVERVTPALNAQKLGNEKSDWRNHLEKMIFHQKVFLQPPARIIVRTSCKTLWKRRDF